MTNAVSFITVPPIREPDVPIHWAAGVADMAQAIVEQRPHRVSAEQAAHVVEVMCAISESAANGHAVEIRSRFVPPEPMPSAL